MRTKKEVKDYLESVEDDYEKYADEKEPTIMEIQMETMEGVLNE